MVIIALVLTATGVGAENIFGAFVAGIVVKLLEPVKSTQRHLDAVGYGFLIPFFFILTGVKLDIPALMQSPTTLILIPLFFIAYVVAKLPAYFGFVRRFSKRNAAAASFLSFSFSVYLFFAYFPFRPKTASEIRQSTMTAAMSGSVFPTGISTVISHR